MENEKEKNCNVTKIIFISSIIFFFSIISLTFGFDGYLLRAQKKEARDLALALSIDQESLPSEKSEEKKQVNRKERTRILSTKTIAEDTI